MVLKYTYIHILLETGNLKTIGLHVLSGNFGTNENLKKKLTFPFKYIFFSKIIRFIYFVCIFIGYFH